NLNRATMQPGADARIAVALAAPAAARDARTVDPSTHHVEHRARRDALPSRGRRTRHQRFDQLPLLIRDFVASHPFDPPRLAVRDEVAASFGLRPFSGR